jgi:hypothetical protein
VPQSDTHKDPGGDGNQPLGLLKGDELMQSIYLGNDRRPRRAQAIRMRVQVSHEDLDSWRVQARREWRASVAALVLLVVTSVVAVARITSFAAAHP